MATVLDNDMDMKEIGKRKQQKQKNMKWSHINKKLSLHSFFTKLENPFSNGWGDVAILLLAELFLLHPLLKTRSLRDGTTLSRSCRLSSISSTQLLCY